MINVIRRGPFDRLNFKSNGFIFQTKHHSELGYPNQTFLRLKSDYPFWILLMDSSGWLLRFFYQKKTIEKSFHLVCLEIHANQM